jgi:hypothetical protein
MRVSLRKLKRRSSSGAACSVRVLFFQESFNEFSISLLGKLVGQKSSVIRVLDEVAGRLESSHPETMAHLNNAFHPATQEELEYFRVKVAADLRAAIMTVRAVHYAKDDAFESQISMPVWRNQV